MTTQKRIISYEPAGKAKRKPPTTPEKRTQAAIKKEIKAWSPPNYNGRRY